MNRIQTLRTRIDQERGRQYQIESEIETMSSRVKIAGRELRKWEEVREIVREVGLKTQEAMQYHIGDITSLALEAVFTDPYELSVEFVQRRNKTECDLLFVRDGESIDPIDGSGGGTVDVASFALRIASWSMKIPKLRNTIVLDEPLRFLSEDKQEQASKMLKEVSARLGIQFIIVTHETTLTQYADKVFTVKLKKGVSHVTGEENRIEETYPEALRSGDK